MRLYVAFAAMFLILAGCSAPSLLITPVASPLTLDEVSVKGGSGLFRAKIALIEISGTLLNAKAGLLTPGENKLSLFDQQMQRAAADPQVKAVVLRINSPGGTVTCSDDMYDIVCKFRGQTHKPVVASAQEVCASGAYYLACGCDKIVAGPTSIVGSIGVIFESFDVSGAMEKLGLKSDPIKSGRLKDMGSPFKPLDPDARKVMQGLIDEYYTRFVGIVRSNRPSLKDSDTPDATDGRVFSGSQALSLGLIDRVGRLDDALNLAGELAHAGGAQVVMYKRPTADRGSIYANSAVPTPQASALFNIQMGQSDLLMPSGFYYLWSNGR